MHPGYDEEWLLPTCYVVSLTNHSPSPCLFMMMGLQLRKNGCEDPSDFRARMFNESRAWFLQEKSDQLMSHSELQELCVLLQKSTPESGNMDYEDFTRVANLLEPGSKARRYFTAKTFGKLCACSASLSSVSLFNYIVRKEWFLQTKVALSLYDDSGQGILTEPDMEKYLDELIPTLTQLQPMDPDLRPFYLCVATRKFFFFLDPHRTCRVKINDILATGFLDTMLELREEELPNPELNWFSLQNTNRIYQLYVGLDEDQNGLLSRQEMASFASNNTTGSQSLTDAFIGRLFEQSVTYAGEVDLKVFVDIVLAVENKKEAAAIHYFFRILDVDQKGYLDTFNLHYFFRDIQEMLAGQKEAPSFEDVHTEILDMVKPKDPPKISLEDLIDCDQGDVVITLLTDVRGCAEYEEREVVPVDESGQEGVHDEEEEQDKNTEQGEETDDGDDGQEDDGDAEADATSETGGDKAPSPESKTDSDTPF